MDITQGKALLRQQYGDLEDWTGGSAAEHGEAVAELLEPLGDEDLLLLALFHAMHELGRANAPVPERVRAEAARIQCRLDKPQSQSRPAAESREAALVQLACDTHTLRGQRLRLLDDETRQRAEQGYARYREAVADLLKDGDLQTLDRPYAG